MYEHVYADDVLNTYRIVGGKLLCETSPWKTEEEV
jgi:hypothetical protein